MAMPVVSVLLDYAKDGTIDDDVSSSVLVDNGGAIEIVRGRDRVRSLAPVRAADASFTLRNNDGAFDPGSSLKRGIPCLITANWLTVDYPMFQGLVDSPLQRSHPRERQTDVICRGTFERLIGKKISTALYQTIRTDVAMGHLLDAVGWPAGDRDLEVGQTTMDWWWLDDEDAFQAMRDLVNTEGPPALANEAPDGIFTFWNRHHVLTATRSTVVQQTFTDLGAAPNFLRPDFDEPYDDGLMNVVNVCTISQRERSADSLAVVWTGPATQIFGPDEVITFPAKDLGGNPFTAAVAPVGGTDYTVTAGSIASAVLDRTSGASATITITAGAGGATITGLQLRAQPVTVDSETDLTNTLDTSASRTANEIQTYPLRIRPEIPLAQARDLANSIVSFYQDGRPQYVLITPNMSTANITAALSLEINDLVRVIDDDIGIDMEGWVSQIKHKITLGRLWTEIAIEESSADLYARWDIGRWDISVWGV